MILSHLDRLVASGRLTGYTVEEDTSYLCARLPTLTYRMYTEGPESHLNFGAFAAAMAGLGAAMRLWRLQGVVAEEGLIRRSPQLCVAAEFVDESGLADALHIINRRFVAAPAAAPGSWRYPDVRVSGAEPLSTAAVYAHQWQIGRSGVVVLTLDPQPPADGARTDRVRVLPRWVGLLQSCSIGAAERSPLLAFSTG